MRRRDSPSDLTDAQWKVLEPLIPPAKEGGHPRTTDMREVLNAIFSLDRTGCQWRALPHECPRLSDGLECFRCLAQQRCLAADDEGAARAGAGEDGTGADAKGGDHREPVGENDAKRGARGYDGGKRVKGRKRHLLVDSQGLIVQVLVHQAGMQDHAGGKPLLWPLCGRLPGMQRVLGRQRVQQRGVRRMGQADAGMDRGDRGASDVSGLRAVWAPEGTVIDWEKIRPSGFHVLPRRWVVERTFAWLSRWRRLSKDYELLRSLEEACICVAMISILLRRLARSAEAGFERKKQAHVA